MKTSVVLRVCVDNLILLFYNRDETVTNSQEYLDEGAAKLFYPGTRDPRVRSFLYVHTYARAIFLLVHIRICNRIG